jgi:plasmid replication initiation protein
MHEKIHEKITSLKNELEQLSVSDNNAKEHINEIISEIENLNDTTEVKDATIDKIKSSIDRFETEHPRATAILNDIMVTLSNMGI